MIDVVDRAQELEERQREEAIARVRVAHSFVPRDPRDSEDCLDCGKPIEPERLRTLNTSRCRACAHTHAKRFEVPHDAR